jgi:hypothetical protein
MTDSKDNLAVVRDVHDGLKLGDRVGYDPPETEEDRAFSRRVQSRYLNELNRRDKRDKVLRDFGDVLLDSGLSKEQIKAGVQKIFGS